MENQWFSAILGKWYSYNIPEGYGNQNGLYRNMSSSHLEFFIECVDKIHPSHKKINFFELCLYVENQAIKQNRYDCGNLIRHLGSMRMKQGRTKTEKQLLKALRGENSIVDGYERSGNSSTWKEEYSRNAWLTPLYQCWYSLNKDNSKPEIGVENRLVINQEVIDEFEKNADKYVLVDIDLSKARGRKYWCCWWYEEGDRERVNEWLKENANDGDWLLWGEGSEGDCRFQVIESVDDGIDEFSLELKGIPGKLSSFLHSDRIPGKRQKAGMDKGGHYKWMDKLEGANGTYAIGEVEQENFFRTLKPIALDGVNFFLSSYHIDMGGNQWEKARSNNAVGFRKSEWRTRRIFDENDPKYDKNYTPKPKDVLLFRRAGAKKEGGLSDIFTIKEVSFDSTKIDKIKNIKPTWDAVDVVVYCENKLDDRGIDLYKANGCVYEGPYDNKAMWSSTFHRSDGEPLNKNDTRGEIFKDGEGEIGYRTFYDYFEHIINGKWWKKIGRVSGVGGNNQLNILRYIVTVYDRMEKIGLGSETGTIVNGESSSGNNDDLIKDIMNETYLEKELVESIVSELLDKKQIVLQGPPGTGKTFVANKIAECMKRHGFGDRGLVQFHASYSYEEFMEGYKPESSSDGQLKFKIKNGIFKEFCLPPVMNTLELGDLYTRNELSDLFKLNDKANLHKYEGKSYEDRYRKFKKSGRHGSLQVGVFLYDKRFEFNDDSIWLFIVGNKKKGKQPDYEDSYDRKNGILNWQTQKAKKNVSDDVIIHHEKYSRKIYVFYAFEQDREGKKNRYEFLGEFGYHSHKELDNEPTKFVFNKKQQFEKKGVFIIDEINRGRTSAIFGELMYLLEYREKNIMLPYSGREFHIPDGVYIIGTMNTADRSIAMVDYALRRRFAFFGLEPNEELFNKRGTEFWIGDGDVRKDVVDVMKELNDAIGKKINGLGEGYRIGHSYFMRKGGIDREQFGRILDFHVGALIREYGQVIDETDFKSLDDIIKKFRQR